MALFENNGLLETWKRNGAICGFTLPFSWNKNRTCFEVKTGNITGFHQFRIAVAMVYFVVATVQVAFTWSDSSRQVVMHSVIFLSAFLEGIITHTVNWLSRKEIVGLFNNLLKFERQNAITNQTKDTKETTKGNVSAQFIKMLINSQILTGFFMPVLYHLDIFRNPCYPMYAGYWLNDQCMDVPLGTSNPAQGSVFEITIKGGIALVSYLNWTFVYIGYCYHMGIELLMHGFYFRNVIQNVGQ